MCSFTFTSETGDTFNVRLVVVTGQHFCLQFARYFENIKTTAFTVVFVLIDSLSLNCDSNYCDMVMWCSRH